MSWPDDLYREVGARCTCDEPTWDDPFVGICSYCEDRNYWESLAEATFTQGIEARQGGNGEAGAVHESPVGAADAPEPQSVKGNPNVQG